MAAKGPDQARANNSKPKPTKVKVSQDTIDKIKQMGMTKALAGIRGTSGAEYKEALRRMYGERRLNEALAKSKPVAKSPDAARAGATKPTTTKPASSKPAASKPSAKKSSGIGGTLKKIATDTVKGTAKDLMTIAPFLVGGGAGVAAKGALKVGATAAKRGVLSKSGQMAAKAGKAVSQNQYDAMLANASKIGKVAAVKTATKAAAKTVAKTTTTAAKTTAKKAVAVKTATAKVGANAATKMRTADEARMAALRAPKVTKPKAKK